MSSLSRIIDKLGKKRHHQATSAIGTLVANDTSES